MKTEEINKKITEFLGKCRHEFDARETCKKCRLIGVINDDYTSEGARRDLLAEVEKKVIAQFGAEAYLIALLAVFSEKAYHPINLITADALTRCRAIVRLLEGNEQS